MCMAGCFDIYRDISAECDYSERSLLGSPEMYAEKLLLEKVRGKNSYQALRLKRWENIL